VVAAYEAGRREPSLKTLEKLVAGAGFMLTTGLAEMGPLRRLVTKHRQEILRLAEERGLANVRLFGSVARGEEGPDSDVDLLVCPGFRTGLLSLIGYEQDLQDLLGVRVDVVPDNAIKQAYAEQILGEAVAL
jgi:predicted nucleotidyltransferase